MSTGKSMSSAGARVQHNNLLDDDDFNNLDDNDAMVEGSSIALDEFDKLELDSEDEITGQNNTSDLPFVDESADEPKDEGEGNLAYDKLPSWLQNSLTDNSKLMKIRAQSVFLIRLKFIEKQKNKMLKLIKKRRYEEAISKCEIIMGMFHWLEFSSDGSDIIERHYLAESNEEVSKISQIRKFSLYHLQYCHGKLHNWEESLSVCDSLIDEFPDFSHGYFSRFQNICGMKNNVVTKANLKDLKRALQLEPTNMKWAKIYEFYKNVVNGRKESSTALELKAKGRRSENDFELHPKPKSSQDKFLEFRQYMQVSLSGLSENPALIVAETPAMKQAFINEVFKDCLTTYGKVGSAELCLENIRTQDPGVSKRNLLKNLRLKQFENRRAMASELAVVTVAHFKPEKYREMLLIRRGGLFHYKQTLSDFDSILAAGAQNDEVFDMDEDELIVKINELRNISDAVICDMLKNSLFIDIIQEDRFFGNTDPNAKTKLQVQHQQEASNAKQLENYADSSEIKKEILDDLNADYYKDEAFISSLYEVMTKKYGVRMSKLSQRLSESKYDESIFSSDKPQDSADAEQPNKSDSNKNKSNKSTLPMYAAILFGLFLLLFHLSIFLTRTQQDNSTNDVYNPSTATSKVRLPKRTSYGTDF